MKKDLLTLHKEIHKPRFSKRQREMYARIREKRARKALLEAIQYFGQYHEHAKEARRIALNDKAHARAMARMERHEKSS